MLKGIFSYLLRYKEFGAVVGFLTIFILFSLLAPKNFLSLSNFGSLLTMASILGIMAIGVSFLMISGEFDLSVGSTFALVPLVLALLVNSGVNPILAFFVCLVVALIVGFANGIITVKTEIPSFITTLGMMMLIRGVVLAITGGFPIPYDGELGLITALNARIFGTNFRVSNLWFIILALIFTIILTRTSYGNWTFATGGNKEVARELGVNAAKVKVINFMLTALLAGFAGCVNLGRFLIVQASQGRGMELEAIAAAVIGGNLLMGGYGTIMGTLIGATLIGMVRSGLILAGAPSYWYQAFVGAILIVAVIINLRIKRVTAG